MGHLFSKAYECREIGIQILILVHIDPPLKDTESVTLCGDHMMDLELNRWVSESFQLPMELFFGQVFAVVEEL